MGREAKPSSEAQPELAPIPGAGVRSLMQGTRPAAAVEQQTQPAASHVVIPCWYFFGVDLLLLALTVGVAWPNPAALTWKGDLLCLLLIIAGGASSVVGVLRMAPRQ